MVDGTTVQRSSVAVEKQKKVRFVDMTGNTTSNSSAGSIIDVGRQESRSRAFKPFATRRDMANFDDDEKRVGQKRSTGVETGSARDVYSKTSESGGGSVVRLTDVSREHQGGNAKTSKAVSVEDHAATLSSEEQSVSFGVGKSLLQRDNCSGHQLVETTPNRVSALFAFFFWGGSSAHIVLRTVLGCCGNFS